MRSTSLDPLKEEKNLNVFLGLLMVALYRRQIDHIHITQEAIEDEAWRNVQVKSYANDNLGGWDYAWKVSGYPEIPLNLGPAKIEKLPPAFSVITGTREMAYILGMLTGAALVICGVAGYAFFSH